MPENIRFLTFCFGGILAIRAVIMYLDEHEKKNRQRYLKNNKKATIESSKKSTRKFGEN